MSTPSKRRPSSRAAGDLRVRRMARAADDGYENDLLPGLRATVEAAHLADELAFATARLEQLGSEPPGLYAEVAAADDLEEAVWLAFLIAYLSPLETDEPFAEIERVRTTWATGSCRTSRASSSARAPRTSRAAGRGHRGLPRLGRPRRVAGGRDRGRRGAGRRSGASSAPSSASRCAASAAAPATTCS